MNIDDSMPQSASALARKQSTQVPTGNANAHAAKSKITEKKAYHNNTLCFLCLESDW